MNNLSEETKKLLKDNTLEIGPVFASEKQLETVAVGDNVEVRKSQYGQFLSITVDGHTHAVNVRNSKPTDSPAKNYRLEVWKAVRTMTPTNGRKINAGDTRVFAIAV